VNNARAPRTSDFFNSRWALSSSSSTGGFATTGGVAPWAGRIIATIGFSAVSAAVSTSPEWQPGLPKTPRRAIRNSGVIASELTLDTGRSPPKNRLGARHRAGSQ